MKHLVLLSGGLDSAALLYELASKQDKADITAVFFNYGQKSYEREKAAVETIALKLGIKLMQIDISEVFKYSNSSLVKHNDSPITKAVITGNKKEHLSENTEIEFRNGVMLSVAVSLALQLHPNEAVTVYCGAAKTREPYPDCSLVFTEYMKLLASYVSSGRVKVKAPLLNLGKDEIVAMAIKLGVPITDTWSCYDGKAAPCGICPACIDRKILEVF